MILYATLAKGSKLPFDNRVNSTRHFMRELNRDIPLRGINWFFDHAETISDESIDRMGRAGTGRQELPATASI